MALETDKHFETALQTDCLPRQIASFEGLTSINVPQSRFSMAFGLSCIIFAKDRQQRTTHPERQTTAPATTKLSLREGFLTSVVITFWERQRLTLTHPSSATTDRCEAYTRQATCYTKPLNKALKKLQYYILHVTLTPKHTWCTLTPDAGRIGLKKQERRIGEWA